MKTVWKYVVTFFKVAFGATIVLVFVIFFPIIGIDPAVKKSSPFGDED